MSYLYYKAINWDEIEDSYDIAIWQKLTNNFWLDIRVPIIGDREAWQQKDNQDREKICHSLAVLSVLYTYQSEIGVPALRGGRRTQQEEAVLNIITFMESVNNKSITRIFKGLVEQKTIASYFEFANENDHLQHILRCLDEVIQKGSALQRRAAFVLLETMVTFGQYAILRQHQELANVQQIIKNMLTGSVIFTDYLGYKFNQSFGELSINNQATFRTWWERLIAVLQPDIENLNMQLNDNDDSINLAVRDGVQRAEEVMKLTNQTGNIDTSLAQLVAQLSQQTQVEQSSDKIIDEDATEAMLATDYDF